MGRRRKALTAAGVEPLVAHAGPRPVTAAYEAAKKLLGRPDRPTALLCFSDVYAAHAIRAAEDLGLRVPDDLSVVGYDDADFASTFRPALTTIRQDVGAKGRAAVTALTALIDGRGPNLPKGPAHRTGHPPLNRRRTATLLAVSLTATRGPRVRAQPLNALESLVR